MAASQNPHDDIESVLITEAAIDARVRELGAEIGAAYAGNDSLILVSVLKGAIVFVADLMRAIPEGRDVLIVEDIIDTGITLNYLTNYLAGKNPRSVKIVTLLSKPARRVVDIPVQWMGFEIPDKFVVGYGLDFGEQYRNLPYVGVLEEA